MEICCKLPQNEDKCRIISELNNGNNTHILGFCICWCYQSFNQQVL